MKTPLTLAFDVYGTLIDTHGITTALAQHTDAETAVRLSHLWRDKQLEYSFRRGLMQHYENFATCTAQALDYACAAQGVTLNAAQKTTLLQAYSKLPAFADAADGLAQLQRNGYKLFAFSNGPAAAVESLLANAGLRGYFADIVSVDEIHTFKPDPAVYAHFLHRSGATATTAWLISSNPFDVLGALAAGLQAAWLQRNPQTLFDPWGPRPTLTINSLAELPAQLAAS